MSSSQHAPRTDEIIADSAGYDAKQRSEYDAGSANAPINLFVE